MGSYWTGADILVQHLGKKEGGLDKLKGKKSRSSSRLAVRKEPIPVLQSAPRCMALTCN
jgi:branched-chain amino acid transport system substrate-binding protein